MIAFSGVQILAGLCRLLQRLVFAKLVSLATILAPPDMGEMPVAEVSIESNFDCYMFATDKRMFPGFGDPAAPNLAQQIAPGDSNVGRTLNQSAISS